MGWRFRDSRVAGNHGVIDLGAKERANVLRDLPRKRCPLIVHGQHHALDLQARIERGLDLLDVLFQLRDTLESEELALHRHQHRVRRDHRVERQQIERRRAIDEDIGDGFLGGSPAADQSGHQ